MFSIVKQKFVDAHWVVLSRGLSFVLSERPTAYEVFYADAERNISAGTATCVAMPKDESTSERAARCVVDARQHKFTCE